LKALALLLAVAASVGPAPGATPDYAGDARALDKIIIENYAYEDHWPGNKLPDSPLLAKERAGVHDHDSLLHYAEDRIASLADHHAITGSSFKDSWAIVPTYADLWAERRGAEYVIDAVRPASPASAAGIGPGDRLVAVSGVPTARAVAAFWRSLGLDVTIRRVTLPSMYTVHSEGPPLSLTRERGGLTVIRINNSLGDQATVAAFDTAMAKLPPRAPLIIDLSDTASGGNSSVARAMMSWFVQQPRNYQIHELPAEQRETGIARRWIEQVLPRRGKFHATLPIIRVGRWTGSMGEGIAIGFAALGARVEGTRMAQLKGAVYDFSLPSSGMVVKLPAERLYTVNGQPREDFVPAGGQR